MDSSRGFGSHPRHRSTEVERRPVQTRFPYGCPAIALVNQATRMHSPDHSPRGTPLARLPTTGRQEPLTAGEYEVSGSLSSPSRGAFHLSLTVLVHYRSLKVFSLGGWSPQLPTRFHVPRGTQDTSQSALPDSLLDSHHLWWGVPAPWGGGACSCGWSYNPSPSSRGRAGLGCSRFARHYYGNLA